MSWSYRHSFMWIGEIFLKLPFNLLRSRKFQFNLFLGLDSDIDLFPGESCVCTVGWECYIFLLFKVLCCCVYSVSHILFKIPHVFFRFQMLSCCSSCCFVVLWYWLWISCCWITEEVIWQHLLGSLGYPFLTTDGWTSSRDVALLGIRTDGF